MEINFLTFFVLRSKTQNREKLVSQIRKKPSKISTISLLEFDPEMSLASNFASSPLKKNLSNKKRANSSSSSSHLTPVKKDLEMMNTKDVNLTTTTSIADYSSTHHYSPEHLYSDFFKDTNQAQNLPSNKQQQQEQEQEPNCLIYGITNKAFFVSQKMQDKPPTHTLKFEHDILFRKTSNIPSTFRPLESKKSSTKINLNESTALLNEAKDTIGFKKEGDEDKEGFLLPWKHQLPSVLTNDYDTLDIKSVNGSLANLSSVTTYSEVFNESKLDSDTSSPSVSSSTNRIRDFNLMCLNNTELVMNSSKITQELEKKLKERRKLMESKSDKFQPKILEVNEFNCMNQTLSLSNLEKRLKDWKIEFNTTKPKLTSSSISCVCPCHNHLHSHSHSKLGSTVCLSRKESKEKEKEKELNILRKTSFQNRQINKAKEVKSAEWSNKCKKPKIVIDNASRLPTKRESIRALIESKAVSQNKQKDVLEMHLNTLLSSRRSTCKIIE